MNDGTQKTISSFFHSSVSQGSWKKRASAPIDLTGESDSEATPPPSKKLRKSDPVIGQRSPFFSKAGTSTSPASRAAALTDQYGFSPMEPKQRVSRTETQKARHEEFKRRLLLDNSIFLPNEKGKGRIPSEDVQEQDADSRSEAISDGEDSDTGFKQLKEMFSNKNNAKGKGKATSMLPIRARKAVEIGPSGQSYTPLELQIRQLKKDNPDTLLMVEVGYKYKFFGDDAKVAAKELGMVAFQDRNYIVASVPTHRRDIHLKKLLSQGYRVGIVNQIETAALKKVGDNKSGPFERKLTHLYTAATYVDDLNSVDDLERYNPPPFTCLIEEWKENNPTNVSIGMITICPATGDVIWDDFEDTAMRIELETRLVHTRPAEILQPRRSLSESTVKMLSHFSGISASGERIRNDYFSEPMSYTDAFSKVSEFYTDKKKFGAASENFRSGKLMGEITAFPKRVVIALAHAIKHLSAFGIADAFLETQFFSKFTTRAHMLLAANTLSNLEIYRNETNNTTHGSLLWILDRTKTKFGARLLRSWVGRPLIDKRVLEERVNAVEEIVESPSDKLLTLRQILKGLPDLAKGLSRIQYGQCTPQELAILLHAFNKIAIAFDEEAFTNPADVGFKSPILNHIIYSLPVLKGPIQGIIGAVNLKQAAQGRKDALWNNHEKYSEIADADMAIQTVEVELMEELKAVRKLLRMPSLQWTTWGLDEYLIEVKKKDNRPIPDSWPMHSSTRAVARYQPPTVRVKVEEKAQYKELLEAAANKAFQSFLEDISRSYYAILRDAINKLAIADCLLSFAHVALRDNYVRPEFVDADVLEIIDGRHPMVEAIRSDPYIPNSVRMGYEEARSKIITGPNMGGKSSCVRMIALIAVMAQIGSYVPASSVKMKLIDAVLTRMGASDDIARGRSTFMVEMSETSDILHTATEKSLVILDELGRGTSTFDGMAIADGVLQYLVQDTKCKTLFITHYPLVATSLEKKFPHDLQNLHMEYETDNRIDGTRSITFLYRLTTGIAGESFGIECGRLAGLPENLLHIASERSSLMREEVEKRIKRNKMQKAVRLMQELRNNSRGIVAMAHLEELKALANSLSNPVQGT